MGELMHRADEFGQNSAQFSQFSGDRAGNRLPQ
jgi:hypothetical protein